MSKRFTKISLAILTLSNIAFLNAQTVIPDVVVVAKPIVEEVRLDDRSSISSVVGEDQLRDLNAPTWPRPYAGPLACQSLDITQLVHMVAIKVALYL